MFIKYLAIRVDAFADPRCKTNKLVSSYRNPAHDHLLSTPVTSSAQLLACRVLPRHARRKRFKHAHRDVAALPARRKTRVHVNERIVLQRKAGLRHTAAKIE